MRFAIAVFLGMSLVAATGFCTTAAAEDNTGEIKIMVDGMHCQGCANGLAQKLIKIVEVKNATADFKTGVAMVYPKVPAKYPSPKLMWETVEKAGFKPTKMTGPFGIYTKKPKS